MPPRSAARFTTLPSQVANVLRESIDRGEWPEWLPGERALTTRLQVSRKTLRKALAQLRHEGRIAPVHGIGNKVQRGSARPKRRPAADPAVVLLTREPLERMRPYTSLWVSDLKTLLFERGARLHLVDGRKFFSLRPEKALERLLGQTPAACWILANSPAATQQWFAERRLPCLIAGSCHPGIDLPHADLDHFALCRHAAGVLLAAGHRRVALLNERSGRAGDAESEAGFIAGVRHSTHDDASPLVLHHEHGPQGVTRALDHVLAMTNPPTALFVSGGANYLTIVSALAQRGLKVPQDVSVISRDDEPFLTAMIPQPARYAANPRAFAKKLLGPILQVLRGEPVNPRVTRILPAYLKGGTLSAPRSAGRR